MNEYLQNVSHQSRVICKPVTHGIWHRQHPLPDRHHRKHPIHQMRRRIRHPAAATGGAPRPPFAGKWNNPVLPASIAMHPQKTVCQYSAIQEGPQLPLNKFRNRGNPLVVLPYGSGEFSAEPQICVSIELKVQCHRARELGRACRGDHGSVIGCESRAGVIDADLWPIG